jgi:uncharacterized protein YfiM (DUF2279 family)
MKMKKPYSKKKMAVNNKGCRCLIQPIIFFIVSSAISGDFKAQAQTDSLTVNRKKLSTFIIVSAAGYTAGIATLNHVWYKDTERQSFRFFNDNAEWKQLDKAGHFLASFYLSDIPARTLRRYGVSGKKADMIGALSGFLLTIPIEIMDGFSDGYGASWGDVAADAVGPAFYLGQKLMWKEIRIHPKFGFHRTGYAPMRPNLLGDNLLSEIVKDYNGQTYWLSVDVDKFVSFPRWLNIAVGYGAHDMVFARDYQNQAQGFNPYRQYYLAVDVDLSGIRSRSRVVQTLVYMVNMIRLPAPALEFSSMGSKFHPFYF